MRISDWSSDVCSSDLSSVIIQQAILPHFREGRMAEGILAGADALIAQLQLPDEEAQARNAEAARLLAERDRGTGPAGFFWIICSARSEEHTSELQSLMRISYAVFCLKKKKDNNTTQRVIPIVEKR